MTAHTDHASLLARADQALAVLDTESEVGGALGRLVTDLRDACRLLSLARQLAATIRGGGAAIDPYGWSSDLDALFDLLTEDTNDG